MEKEKILAKCLPPWPDLTESERKMLIDNAIYRTFKQGDQIHQVTNDCLGLIFIIEGTLRAFITSEQGKQITLYRLFDNDICLFSASCMLKSITFDVQIECEIDCEILLIPTTKYEKIINESKAINNYTSEILSSRFSDVMWILEQLVFHSLDKRLANYLIEHMDVDNNIHTTHEKIANDLGTAREVISRMLKYFEKEALVELKRNNITVKNMKELIKISDK